MDYVTKIKVLKQHNVMFYRIKKLLIFTLGLWVKIVFDKYKYAYEIKYHGIANILIRTVKFSEVCHLK